MPESQDNWAGYQRLVLAELERHNAAMREMDLRLQAMQVDIALIKAQAVEAAELARKVRELDALVDRRLRALEHDGGTDSLDKRIRALENNTLASETIERYRKWLVGLAITTLVSVIIPIIRIYIGQ